jgi:hypothetical protein
MAARKGLNDVPDFSQTVAAVWRQMLREAQFFQEGRAGLHDFRRRLSAVNLAEQHSHSLDNGGIRIGAKLAPSVREFLDKPDLGQAAFHAKGLGLELILQRRRGPPAAHNITEPVLRGFQGPQRRGQLPLFFRNRHLSTTYRGSGSSSK